MAVEVDDVETGFVGLCVLTLSSGRRLGNFMDAEAISAPKVEGGISGSRKDFVEVVDKGLFASHEVHHAGCILLHGESPLPGVTLHERTAPFIGVEIFVEPTRGIAPLEETV